MITDLDQIFSVSAQGMKRSMIRELLKLSQKPGIISFGGGFPAPDSFPIEEIKEITNEILTEEGAQALQYGATEGDNDLRELMVKRYQEQGIKVDMENLVILTSSQQGLDLVPKIFINPGDKIICGLPSYLGGLSAFSNYGAKLVGVELDEKGMSAEKLEAALEAMKQKGEKPKFIYVIPDFQNPAGITMPKDRRLEILALAKKYDVLILEDSPYRELRFTGTPQPMLYDLDSSGHVMTLGTFSKIFAPSFRIGWILAHPDIIDKIVKAKQATDLCTSPLVQKIAFRYINKGYFDVNLKKIIESYRVKREVMLNSLKEFMPAGVTWTEPEGGLFLFVTLPEYIDAEELFKVAIEQNVAFVPGTAFYCDGGGKNTMRINFSYITQEQTKEGIKRLGNAIKLMIR